ncbi:MAG: FG-GAP repeat protein [Planctomycetota bacterium]|nr:FG-GAP repeat protein [Planctomycetota bacterium]
MAAFLIVLAPNAFAQHIEDFKLLASDGSPNDRFGWSVAIDGSPGNEVAIVGATEDDENGLISGSAYIYRNSGSTWMEESKLLASDGAAGDKFGISVSISGAVGNEVAIVGAHSDDDNGSNSGSAYIFRFDGTTWVEEAKLLASDGEADDIFGWSVSISGPPGNEIAIVGAFLDDDNGFNSGSAYIYRFNGTAWVEEAKLLASDGATIDTFGYTVAINGTLGHDVAIVGARNDDESGIKSGSAYIYRFNGGTWVEEAKLFASDGAANDHFGWSVSIHGTSEQEIVTIGAPGYDTIVTDSGSAYIFRFNGETWVEEAKLLASDGAMEDIFGFRVSMTGALENETVIVSSWADSDNGVLAGSAYIYQFDSESWVEKAKLLASDGVEFDHFASSVSLSGPPGSEIAIIGAWADDDNGVSSGSVYVFDIAAAICSRDVNDSGAVDVFDLLVLLSAWGPITESPADINRDGIVDVLDLLFLLAAWGDC